MLYSNVESDDVGPSRGMRERFAELTPQLTTLLGEIKQIIDAELPTFNQLVQSKGAGPIILKG